MILKLNTSEEIGRAFLQLIACIEAVATGYSPEQLQVTILSEDPLPKTVAARTHYTANLPKLQDGTFDMTAVESTVRQNLESVGAHTLNGIVYQDVVTATLSGEMATEGAIRTKRLMKPGSSQGAIQKLKAMGFISGHDIQRAE